MTTTDVQKRPSIPWGSRASPIEDMGTALDCLVLRHLQGLCWALPLQPGFHA